MTGEYSPKSWFWEFLKMYTKLLIMCCLTFFEYDIPNKVIRLSIFSVINDRLEVFKIIFHLYYLFFSFFYHLDSIHFLADGVLRTTAFLSQAIHPGEIH